MNETYPVMSTLPGRGASRGFPWAPLAEVVSALGVLGLAGACLVLLVSTLDSGRQAFGNAGADLPTPVSYGAPHAQLEGVHLYIVVAGSERADELARSLSKESELRVSLGETPRDAEVIAADDEAAAQAIAWSINDQANLPGVAPMAAVVVR